MQELTIVIPMWNGSETIGRSLGSLCRQTPCAGSVHVVVAVNDGRDDSVASAEGWRARLAARGVRLSVMATPPGRRAAITAGEALAAPGPRLYVDQDARLSDGAIAAFLDAVADGGPRFVTFAPRFTASGSWLVRRFNRAWLEMPYVRRSPVVCGVFGVSAAGRERWQDLPAVRSDDKFVRLRFDPGERVLLTGQSYEVVAATDVFALVRNRVRYAMGNRELRKVAGAAGDASRRGGWSLLWKDPVGGVILGAVMLMAGALARMRRD